ncbi:MAG TPA: DUF4838 domain-containing protein [Armatimonadota bacterium]|jgi:hypothetical protein
MTTSNPVVSDIRISVVTGNPTVEYAAAELQRCLAAMTGRKVLLAEGGIRLGIISDFPGLSAPEVADPAMDDAIDIDVRNGIGHIAGINSRSVLIAAYRYLTELGCRWVRPGFDGEFIPQISSTPDVCVNETASYRHRGICIEGAVSYEDVRDTIEWMPKVGFNSFFTQFRESYTFFDKWYSHDSNPYVKADHLPVETAYKFINDLVDEMQKRDMLYHGVGHGWTCEPFGISCLGWQKEKGEPSDDIKQYLAMVDGERTFWKGAPVDTNLCYGNPKVRRLIIEDIANYSAQHPEVDLLHFWLADGMNNHCECELCRDTRPSDFFVSMLNDLDALLTERNLSTKIVFLIYVDLLWPPVKEKILNPDRFLMMFAPITRTYTNSFAVSGELPEVPAYVRNKLEMPSSVESNVAFLAAWQKMFAGDSFDFDYHLMWEHYNDPGYGEISETLSEDIKGLKDIGLNGFISCQTQRSYLPTGLPMVAMGLTLWNSSLDFESIAADYFKSAFGPDAALCRTYMDKLTELFDPVYMRAEKPTVSAEAAERLGRVSGVVAEFAPVIERNMTSANACWSQSWTYLKYHGQICVALAKTLEARAKDDKENADSLREELIDLLWKIEPEIHSVMDVWVFIKYWLLPTKFGFPIGEPEAP